MSTTTPLSNTHLLSVLSKSERTQIHILDQSIRCFVHRGFDGASFTELSKFTGVNRGLIVHYFGTKQDLIEQTLSFVGSSLRTFTDEFMKNHLEITDLLERYVEATFTWARERPDHASYMVFCIQRTSHDRVVAKAIRGVFQFAWKRLGEMVVSDPALVKLSKERVEALSQRLHAAVVGCVVMSITMGPETLELFSSHCKASIADIKSAAAPF